MTSPALKMNELRRMAYLDALGIDAYVSRGQLPGAAVTQRLAIVPSQSRPASPVTSGVVIEDEPASAALRELESRPVAAQVPHIDSAPRSPSSPVATPPVPPQKTVPRFSLVAIAAGGWLWLEELGDMPLATEQVRLVQAMGHALKVIGRDAGPAPTAVAQSNAAQPDVAHFRWPIHTNSQLELGEEAARASVAGFIGRKLEQQHCRGLVLLGESCRARVPLEPLGVATASTLSSAEILANPQLKRQVWRDLLPLVSGT